MVGEPILSRSLKSSGGTESTGGSARLMAAEVHAQFVKGLQIPGRAPQLFPPWRNDRNRAGIHISLYQLQLAARGHLGRWDEFHTWNACNCQAWEERGMRRLRIWISGRRWAPVPHAPPGPGQGRDPSAEVRDSQRFKDLWLSRTSALGFQSKEGHALPSDGSGGQSLLLRHSRDCPPPPSEGRDAIAVCLLFLKFKSAY